MPILQLDVMINWFPGNSLTVVLDCFSMTEQPHLSIQNTETYLVYYFQLLVFLSAKPEGSGLHQGASGHPGRSPAPSNGRVENYNPHGVSHPT